MSSLLCTQSSGQCTRGWIIYIRCQGLTQAHSDFQHAISQETACNWLYCTHAVVSSIWCWLFVRPWQLCHGVKCVLMCCVWEWNTRRENVEKRISVIQLLNHIVKIGIHYCSENEGRTFSPSFSCMYTHTVKFTLLRYWLPGLNHTHEFADGFPTEEDQRWPPQIA